MESTGNRIHTPLAEYASNPERKNTPCISDVAGVIFSKKGKGVFLSGFCPPGIRADGVQMQLGRGKAKLFLWEEKDLLCLDSILVWRDFPAQEGAGGMRGGYYSSQERVMY